MAITHLHNSVKPTIPNHKSTTPNRKPALKGTLKRPGQPRTPKVVRFNEGSEATDIITGDHIQQSLMTGTEYRKQFYGRHRRRATRYDTPGDRSQPFTPKVKKSRSSAEAHADDPDWVWVSCELPDDQGLTQHQSDDDSDWVSHAPSDQTSKSLLTFACRLSLSALGAVGSVPHR
ncbi:hypothetical protein BJ170DRAFT_180337 [Xylariales sp. AK1849]|nr:hypothetical protein BJ170DRAFT_180337 [Xylariales sp. AK1849]